MKKTALILVAVLFGFGLQNASAQTTTQSDTSLSYQHITGEPFYTRFDYTKLGDKQSWINSEGIYTTILPFTVSKAIAPNELFWLALYKPAGSKLESWGIYKPDYKFICRDFTIYRIGAEEYILQSQHDLTEQIVPGEYLVGIMFSEKPAPFADVQVSVGYSTRQVYDEYAAKLEKKQLANDKSSQLVGTKWSKFFWYEDDYDEVEIFCDEFGYEFLNNKKVTLWHYSHEYEKVSKSTGTYTFDGKEGVIVLDKEPSHFLISGDKLTVKGSRHDLVFIKVPKFQRIKE